MSEVRYGGVVSYERGTPVGYMVLGATVLGEEDLARPEVQPAPHHVVRREPEQDDVLDSGVQRFRGGLVVKAHRLCVSLNYRLESNKEEQNPASVALAPPRRPT